MSSNSLSFMNIANIDGEEPYGSTLKMIRIDGFRHDLQVPIAPMRPSVGPNTTFRRSYCEHGLFTVFKRLDKTSGKIFDLCSQAAVIPQIAIYLCQSDESTGLMSSGDFGPAPFLSIVMANAVIAQFTYEMHSDWPSEQIDIRYTSISWILDWISPVDGTAANLGAVGWNGLTNMPTPPVAASNAIPASVKYSS